MQRFTLLSVLLVSCAKGENVNLSAGGGLSAGPVFSPDLPPSLPTDGTPSPDLPGESMWTTTESYPIPTGGWSEETSLDMGLMSTSTGETTGEINEGTSGSQGTTQGSSDTGSGTSGVMPDPQPIDGLYKTCSDNAECDLRLTDGCFIITNADMEIEDGFCTLLCNDVMDCGMRPANILGAPVCAEITPGQKICAIMCMDSLDCPGGMLCKNVKPAGLFCI